MNRYQLFLQEYKRKGCSFQDAREDWQLMTEKQKNEYKPDPTIEEMINVVPALALNRSQKREWLMFLAKYRINTPQYEYCIERARKEYQIYIKKKEEAEKPKAKLQKPTMKNMFKKSSSGPNY